MRVRMKRKPTMRAQPIHDGDAHGQTELLTAYPVDQRFEEGREARGLEAHKPLRQPVQPRFTRGDLIESPEIRPKAKQPLESRTHLCLGRSAKPGAGHRDFEHGSSLLYGHPHSLVSDNQDPPIGVSLPVIHCIVQASPKRPGGQIQSERRHWTE